MWMCAADPVMFLPAASAAEAWPFLSFSISLLLQIYQPAYGASISRTAHREAVFVSQTHRACEFVEVICSAPVAASLPGSLSASHSAGSWPSVLYVTEEWHTQPLLTFCRVKETSPFDVSLQKKEYKIFLFASGLFTVSVFHTAQVKGKP